MGLPSLLLPVRYLASVSWYAAVANFPNTGIDINARYDKRCKEVHRATIIDANGKINLTVPIAKPASLLNTPVSELVISGHGSWWNVHLTALESAYGRTPFFEYYEDEFRPFYNKEWAGRRLVDYTTGLDALLRRLIGISPSTCSEGTSVKDIAATVPEYYQVRRERFGFIEGLSIVDLLFNMGPESLIVLKNCRNISVNSHPVKEL